MPNQIASSTAIVRATFAGLAAEAHISRGDVVSLHRHLFAESSLERREAAALFDLERAALTRCEAWTSFLIEAITDHVVWGSRPTGCLDEAQAEWLLLHVDAARTPASFAILVNVLEEAQHVPGWFEAAVKARAMAGWPGVSCPETSSSHPLPAAA